MLLALGGLWFYFLRALWSGGVVIGLLCLVCLALIWALLAGKDAGASELRKYSNAQSTQIARMNGTVPPVVTAVPTRQR